MHLCSAGGTSPPKTPTRRFFPILPAGLGPFYGRRDHRRRLSVSVAEMVHLTPVEQPQMTTTRAAPWPAFVTLENLPSKVPAIDQAVDPFISAEPVTNAASAARCAPLKG